MKRIIIEQSQNKQLRLCIMLIILIAVCIFDITINKRSIVESILVKGFGCLGVVFFGVCSIGIFKDFIKPRPLLVADKKRNFI